MNVLQEVYKTIWKCIMKNFKWLINIANGIRNFYKKFFDVITTIVLKTYSETSSIDWYQSS